MVSQAEKPPASTTPRLSQSTPKPLQFDPIINSPSSKNLLNRLSQANTPDPMSNPLNISSSTPIPTPPPNHPFLPFNFQPNMVAAAFQQLIQQSGAQNPDQFLQQQAHNFFSKLAQQQDQTNLNTSTTNSSCSSPVPSLIEEPQPPPIPINIVVNKPAELIKPDSNAMFVRVWDRGMNSCSRTDLLFKYLPNAKYLKVKEELRLSKEASSMKQSSSSSSLKDLSLNKCNSPFTNSNAMNNSFKDVKSSEKQAGAKPEHNGAKFMPKEAGLGNYIEVFYYLFEMNL